MTLTTTNQSSAKRFRPQFEALEDRCVPAIIFGATDNGVTAFNADTGGVRKITAYEPTMIDEGLDGYVFTSIEGSKKGIWAYDYWNDDWTKILQFPATALSATDENELFYSVHPSDSNWPGTYEVTSIQWGSLNPSKHEANQINRRTATQLAAVDYHRVFAVFDDGIHKYDSGWSHISQHIPTVMAGSYGAYDMELFASFADNTWLWKSGGVNDWDVIAPAEATAIDATSIGASAVISFAGNSYFDQGTYVANEYGDITGKMSEYEALDISLDSSGTVIVTGWGTLIGKGGDWDWLSPYWQPDLAS